MFKLNFILKIVTILLLVVFPQSRLLFAKNLYVNCGGDFKSFLRNIGDVAIDKGINKNDVLLVLKNSKRSKKVISLDRKQSTFRLSFTDFSKKAINTYRLKNGKKNRDDKAEIRAKEKFILSITENGFGKKTSHFDYRVTNRGGKGIIGIINSPRNGNISSSFPVFEGDEILISTNKGRVIRVAVKEIRTAGRNTQGVRIIKLSGEEKVVSADKIDDNLV